MTATDSVYVIRKAVAADEPAIQAMVRSERLNPHHLYFENFAVAASDDQLIGATQVRRHRDGSRELGSVVVAPSWRGRGISAELIGSLLKTETGVVYVITRKAHAVHYARWGFEAIAPRSAPAPVRFNYRVGSLIGGAMAVLQWRKINRLVILRRPAAPLRERLREATAAIQGNRSSPVTDVGYAIRKAVTEDEPGIRALVLSERMRPIDLKPANFLVAVNNDEIIGTVQMRHHPGGVLELGSLVVASKWRRKGIAARLIDTLLAGDARPVYMITARAQARRYVRWGFESVTGSAVPASIRLHYSLGRLGSIVSLWRGCQVRRLVILRRPGVSARLAA